MNNRAIIVAIVDKLIECATKAWTDESFKARFEAAAGSALDALHKRPDDNYGISNFAAAFLVASSMGVVMREGPGNRYNRIQRELLSEIISRFPEFPDATKSVSAYLNTLMQRSPERLLEAGEGAATLEERKAKGIGFWSFMWLGHQIAKGMVKGEVM